MFKSICLALCAIFVVLFVGCEGRTGEIGAPIGQLYDRQVSQLQVGQSTPADLQRAFGKWTVSLKEASIEKGHQVAIWEVFRGGNMDVGQFLMWGQIAHDDDQAMLFQFEDGVLVSFRSVVFGDGEVNEPQAFGKPPPQKLDNMGFPINANQSGVVSSADVR